jgi:hypothetical protein
MHDSIVQHGQHVRHWGGNLTSSPILRSGPSASVADRRADELRPGRPSEVARCSAQIAADASSVATVPPVAVQRTDADPAERYDGTPFTDRGFGMCLPSSTSPTTSPVNWMPHKVSHLLRGTSPSEDQQAPASGTGMPETLHSVARRLLPSATVRHPLNQQHAEPLP